MNTFLLLYLLCAAITVVFATVINGKEMAYCKVLAPGNVMTPNWPNFAFLALLWFAYWPQYVVYRNTMGRLPKDPGVRQKTAAQAMGIPTQEAPPRG